MLRKYLLFVLTSLSMYAFYACSSNQLQVDKTNFEEEIALQQNLIFTFNHDVVPDSILSKWDTTDYVQFEPRVQGKFKWNAPNELIFSPDLGFRPSTNYQAKLTEKIGKIPGASSQSVDTDKTIAFHTPYLKLTSSDIVWTKNSSGVIEALFNLNFNYKVNPTDLGNLLHVKINGKDASFKVNTTTPTDVIQIAAAQPTGTNWDEKVADITINKGLKCAESDYVSPEPMSLRTELPSKANFQITQAVAEYELEDGFIHVYTNQTVENNSIAKFISLSPKVDFQVELEDYGFVIKGKFQPGTYQLRVSSELRGIFGGRLKEDYQQAIVFGEMQPAIAFVSKKGVYLSSNGSKNVGIRIINVAKVRVQVFKIYENNLLAFFRNNGLNGGYEEEYDDYEPNLYIDENDNTYGDQVLDREYESRQLGKAGNVQLLNLDLQSLNDFQGIYVVKVSSTEDQYIKASKLVSISDIGLIVRETENDVVVFANSILTAKALSGIKVSLISSNNQNIYQAETDGDGIATFADIRTKAPNFRVQMVTARHGDKAGDFNYLHFDQTRVETSRAEVGGLHENPSGYQAFLYGDRNIYRPGETMYLHAIVRDGQWKSIEKVPMKLKIVLPDGKEFTTIKANLNEQSAFGATVKLPVATVTGTYQAELYTSNDVLLTSKSISVEEFIPDRIKVNVALNKESVKAGEEIELTATALNLFGPPAANRNYETTFSLSRKYFAPEGFPNYNFSLNGTEKKTFEQTLRQGTTDAEGSFTENFDIPAEYKDLGLLQGSIFTTVFDESGRPVNRASRFDVLTQDVFYGIQYFDTYVDTRQALQIPLVALNKDGKPLNATGKVRMMKFNWQTVLEKDDYGSFRYVSRKQEQVLEERTIKFNNGRANYSFVPNLSGEYELQLSRQGAEAYVAQDFYAYGYGNTQNSSFEVNTDGQITIELDKKKYEVGDDAKVLLKTPFAGRILVTVERNRVFEHFYVDSDKKSASITIPIKKEYLPNAYITATLIKPLDDGTIPLTVAHGFAPFLAERKESLLPLTITAAAQSKSKTKQTITVKSRPESDIEVTLAVVDEGILQLKNYETPNPHAFFYQKRALEVNSYDVYPLLLPEYSGGSRKSSTGGDGYDLKNRVNPLTNKRVQLVAFWSGVLKTNGDGEATYTIDIPQFSGDLRMMAVAYKDDAFGSAQANMKIADPIVVSTSLPRFASPNDQLQVPVTLSNTTKQAGNVSVKIRATGALSVNGDADQSINIQPNSEAQVQFAVNAKDAVGNGQVIVEVNGLGGTYSETTDLTVRPITSLQKISGNGVAAAGKTSTFSLANNFIPSTASGKLVISKSPVVQFASSLDFLLQYPYGCVEQTVSSAFPQLYFADLTKSILQTRNTTQLANNTATYNVQEAIHKLQTMQLYNGALSYWPGGGSESWWGSAYAANFLLEARKAGYDVNNKVVDRLLSYLQQQVRKKQTEEYFYYSDANQAQGSRTQKLPYRKSKYIAPKEVFYSLYVLALGARQDVATMNYYKSNRQLMALDGKYLLASTYRILGDQASFNAVLPKSFQGEVAETAFGGSFYSYVRDEAISLNALLEADPGNQQIPMLARHLSEQMKRQYSGDYYYYSTQENAWALLALGKIAKKAASNDVRAEIKAGGSSLGSFTGEDLVLKQGVAGKNISIAPSGTGSLYYFWQAQGLSTSNDVKEEDSFLQVRKTFLDRFGKAISGNSFRQNDLVVVKITLASTDGSTVDNVVITDMLPAGFEIENPRISSFPEMTWANNAATPEHQDIRDDRINLFATARGTAQTFYYVVRAVSKGTFKMGPVSADAMYNGEYHSQNGAGEITVEGKEGAVGMKEE
ncbi:MAG: alpha-2-macroglobulin [Bacteroidota bacterium]